MLTPATALLTCSLCTFALVTPTPALPLARAETVAEAKGAPSVRVVVDASTLGDAAPYFQEQARIRLATQLENSGYFLVEDVDADVTVRVRLTFFNEEDLDYQIDVDISAGAELVRLRTEACAQCVDADLLDKVSGEGPEVEVAIEKLLAKVRANSNSAHRPVVEPRGETVAPIGVLGGVGIGVAVLGLGATIAGGVEIGRGRVYDLTEEEREKATTPTLAYTDHTKPGAVLVGVGATALIAGSVMLAVDLSRRGKRRKQGQTGAAFPLLGPGVVGLGYTTRF